MKSIKELRENIERAQAEYLAADIEHPTASTLAKEDLANARHEYQHACVGVVESLIACRENNEVDIQAADAALDVVVLELWK